MMPAKLGEAYYNCAVNCGTGRAKKLLIAAKGSAVRFLDEQSAFYRRLVDARPSASKYLRGWLNRVNALRTFLHL